MSVGRPELIELHTLSRSKDAQEVPVFADFPQQKAGFLLSHPTCPLPVIPPLKIKLQPQLQPQAHLLPYSLGTLVEVRQEQEQTGWPRTGDARPQAVPVTF